VGAVCVVVVDELLQHLREVAWSGDQEMVQVFPAQCLDPSFGDGVRPGARTGVWMMRMSAPAKTASKAAVHVLSRSRIRNRNCSAWSPRSISRLRACWGDPGAGGVGGDPGEVHAAAMLDHDQDVEAAQEDGVDVGEVDREDRVSLRGQELSPGRPGPSRGGIETGFLEDSPDGGRGDRMVEADQLAVDASVPPPGVLPGHP
jgi:hypothetical protein